MKLRNKKTGQIYNACHIAFGESIEGLEKKQWKTLEEFNEDWEDVPEEKKYWHIDADFGICSTMEDPDNLPKDKAEMGNLFETREEAEQAVEKLKALKRLKDRGFKIDLWDYDGGNYQEGIQTGRILFRVEDYEENDNDINLLFGDEK